MLHLPGDRADGELIECGGLELDLPVGLAHLLEDRDEPVGGGPPLTPVGDRGGQRALQDADVLRTARCSQLSRLVWGARPSPGELRRRPTWRGAARVKGYRMTKPRRRADGPGSRSGS